MFQNMHVNRKICYFSALEYTLRSVLLASLLCRTAFCCWLTANILFSMPVILYAGYMMLATAAFIFFSMASFSTIFNLPQCTFTIGDAAFETSYSHSFWLALATGMQA